MHTHIGRGQRERIFKADSTLSVEPDVGLDPRTYEIMTWAETRSQMLNRLSYPGTPSMGILKMQLG